MPERVNRDPLRQTLHAEARGKSTGGITHEAKQIRDGITAVFGEPLKTIETALADDAFVNGLALTATQEGLTADDVAATWKEVHRHISIQANFDARNKLEADRNAAGRNPIERFKVALREAGEVFGKGLASEVVAKQKEAVAKEAYMKGLVVSALESRVMKRRLEQYYKLGDPTIQATVAEFLTGKATYDQLVNNPTYLAGIEKIASGIVIGDTFQIETPNPDPKKPDPVKVDIDSKDPAVKKAIRKHLQFVLRTEIVQLAQAKQLEVLSSDEHKAEAPTGLKDKTWAVAKGVFGSGTFWGVGTRTVTRLAMGGVFGAAIVSGGWVGVAVGAGIGMTAGALAGAARESINAKHREKKHRLDAALGAISNEVVKSATGIDKELTTKTTALHAILETGTVDQKKAAVVELYKTVADTQARLLRSRVGDPVLNAGGLDDEEATAALDASVKPRQKQDYISFGVENRFKSQLQLLSNLEKSLAAIELVLDQDEALAKDCRIAMVTVNTEVDKALRTAQQTLAERIDAENSRYIIRAAIFGGFAGGISAAAVDGLHAVWPGSADTAATASADTTSTPHGPRIPFIPSAEAAEPSHIIDQASSHFTGATELSASQPVPISFQDQDYVMSVDTHGIAHLDHITAAGAHVQVAEAFSLTSTEPGNPHFFIDNSGDHVTIYDASTHQQLASFDGTHGVVTSAAEPAPGGSVDSIFADAKVKTILDKMGVQQGEVQYDPNTHLFHIPDDAVKGEYLGQTAGWRARRLEFILKAMQDNKSESADMIVARAERATRHLLLEGKKYPDANAAYAEAFGKSSDFIIHNEIPWVDGPSSHVGKQWMHLIDELKQTHVNVDHAAGAAHNTAAGAPVAPGADHAATAASGSAHGAGGETAAAAGHKHLENFSKNFGEQLAIDMSLRGMGEAMLGMGLVGVAEFAYAKPVLERAVANRTEFTTTDSDEFHVKETTLPDVHETATAIKTKELEGSKPERERVALAEIKATVTAAEVAVTPGMAAIKTTADALAAGSSIDVAIIDGLVANVANFTIIADEVARAKLVLDKTGADFTYVDLDKRSNAEGLKKWIDAHEKVADFQKTVKDGMKALIVSAAADITAMRKTDDGTKPPADRKQQLVDVLQPKLIIADKAASLVPAVIPDAAWKTELESARDAALQEIEQAVLVIDFLERIKGVPDAKKFILDRFTTETCFVDNPPTLPDPGKAKFLAKFLAESVSKKFPAGKAGLEAMGFLDKSDPMDPVGVDEKKRITEVLDCLFRGESDIFKV